MMKTYYKEMMVSLVAAFAIGYFNPILGIVAFLVIGSILSRGSMTDAELQKAVDSIPETKSGSSLDRDLRYTHIN